MSKLNKYIVTYQIQILIDNEGNHMSRKEFDQYGDICPTIVQDDEFQARSNSEAMKIAEQKYNGFKTINGEKYNDPSLDGERVFLFLETLWNADYETIEQYL